MRKYNSVNVRIIRKYMEYLLNTGKYTLKSIDQKLKAIEYFQKETNYNVFSSFKSKDVEKFKNKMTVSVENMSGLKSYSIHTVANWRNHVKQFFQWLVNQKGYKHIQKADIDYFNLTKDELNVLKNYMVVRYPTYEIIKKLFDSIDDTTEIAMRDKFLVAFLFLTGIRIDALISLPLRAVDPVRKVVYQNPAFKVRTKRNKKFSSVILGFDKEMEIYIVKYIDFLKNDKLFSLDAPLFPATLLEHKKGTYSYEANKLVNKYYQVPNVINNILVFRFKLAGLDYYRPHSFKHANAFYAPKACKNALQFKAISEHLGHSSIATSIASYSRLSEDMVVDILTKMDFSLDRNSDSSDITLEDIESLPKSFKEIVKNLIKQNNDQNGF